MSRATQADALLHGLASGLLAAVGTSQGRNLTLRQLASLLLLCTAPGPCTVRGLAADLRISKSAMSRALDSLSEAGLARRGPDPRDRRSVLVEPTPEGRALAQRIAAAVAAEVAERLARGSDAAGRDRA